MSGRRRWVAAAAVLVVAVAAGATWVALDSSSSPQPRRTTATRLPHRSTPRPAVLAALTPAPSAPRAAAVARALARVVRDPAFGGALAGVVADAGSGAPLWSLRAGTELPPASTAKLLTATAALEVLGPDATLPTRVVRAGSTLYLVGGGDVTLAVAPPRRPAFPVTATLAELARRTVAALGSRAVTRLCVDTSAWSGPAAAPGWKPGYFTGGDIARLSPLEVDEGDVRGVHPRHGNIPRVADPGAQAGALFVGALRDRGLHVRGGACSVTAPKTAVPVASVQSAPVSDLVQRMLAVSDNDLAESLGRAIAVRSASPPTFDGEARAIIASTRRAGLDVSAVHLVDASGLSRLDRVTPALLVQLLRLGLGDGHPELRPLVQGLPVAGFSGTLGDRYRNRRAAAAAGVARAKTGTLLGVSAIAGYLTDRDGRTLVYALVTDRAQGVDRTEAALDRVVARLAGCGCG